MKKSDLIAQVAEKAELSKAAASRAIHALFDTSSGAIAEAVRAGEHVAIPGFGRFRSKTRAARKGRNPQTGAEIDIPERTTVQFSVGKGLQESLSATPDKRGTKAGGAKAGGAKAGGGKSGGGKSGGKAAGAKKQAGGQRGASTKK